MEPKVSSSLERTLRRSSLSSFLFLFLCDERIAKRVRFRDENCCIGEGGGASCTKVQACVFSLLAIELPDRRVAPRSASPATLPVVTAVLAEVREHVLVDALSYKVANLHWSSVVVHPVSEEIEPRVPPDVRVRLE